MNSSVYVFVFVALAAFAVDAAVVPLNGFWGNGLYTNGLSLNNMFGTGAVNGVSGTAFTLGPVNTLKLVPATSLVSTTARSAPSTQVVSSAPVNFPSVINPAPGVRCVCTATNVEPSMNIQNLGSFGFAY